MIIAQRTKKAFLRTPFLFSLEQWLCSSLLPFKVMIKIVTPLIFHSITRSVLNLADSISGLTLDLMLRALSLGFLISCPFAHLPLSSACHIFHFSFNTIFIHEYPPFDKTYTTVRLPVMSWKINAITASTSSR